MKIYNENLYRILVILSFAIIILTSFHFAKIVNAGGPTTTLSHTNDKPNSYALCAAQPPVIHSVGVLSSETWKPRIVTDTPWLQLINPEPTEGNGFVQYQLEPNHTSFHRAAVIMIGSSEFIVVQEEFDETKPCSPQTDASNIQLSANAENVSLTIHDQELGREWRIETSGVEWLQIENPTGRGNGASNLSFLKNVSSEARMTTITVGDKIIPIIQGGARR